MGSIPGSFLSCSVNICLCLAYASQEGEKRSFARRILLGKKEDWVNTLQQFNFPGSTRWCPGWMCVLLTRFRIHRWEVTILPSKTRLGTINSGRFRVSYSRYHRCPPGEEYRPPRRKPVFRTADPACESLKGREPLGRHRLRKEKTLWVEVSWKPNTQNIP